MTHPRITRRAVALLAVLVLTVVAALTLTAGPAVADGGGMAQTRVAASNPDLGAGVGPADHVVAGQGRETAGSSYDFALGCCVATESPALACHSFAAATLVLMADGTRKAIADVKVGDKVLATDPDTGETSVREVTELHVNDDTDLADVTVRSDSGGTDTIHTTQHHQFWDQTEHRWVDAADLRSGDQLRSEDGDPVTVTDVHSFVGAGKMHDLTVDGVHTFYVTAAGEAVLVHNCGGLGEFADAQQANAGRHGAQYASEYTSPSGETYRSVNGHGLEAPDELQSVLDDVGHHGGCSEVGCLIKAYEAEGPEAIRGGSMKTVHVFNEESSRAALHGMPANPCGRCQAMLRQLGISWG